MNIDIDNVFKKLLQASNSEFKFHSGRDHCANYIYHIASYKHLYCEYKKKSPHEEIRVSLNMHWKNTGKIH